MAHNLEQKTDGSASFFSVKEKAWHGLGKVLDKCPTSEEAIILVNLNYEVNKRPNIHRLPSGAEIVSENSFYTYRADNEAVLGDKVGSRYEVIQNRNAFDFFDAIVGKGEAIYETAGVLGKGERIFVTAKLPDYIEVGKGDLIEQYIFLTMSHDGSGAIVAAFSPQRVVCQNTLNAALKNCSNMVKIRHTTNAKEKLLNAHKIMGISNKLKTELEGIFNAMAKVKIDDKQLKDLIAKAMSPTAEVLSKVNAKEELSTRFENMVNDVYGYAMSHSTQQMDATKGNLYGFYNSVTGYFQNAKDFKSADDKLESILLPTGMGYKRQQAAFDLAMSMMP